MAVTAHHQRAMSLPLSAAILWRTLLGGVIGGAVLGGLYATSFALFPTPWVAGNNPFWLGWAIAGSVLGGIVAWIAYRTHNRLNHLIVGLLGKLLGIIIGSGIYLTGGWLLALTPDAIYSGEGGPAERALRGLGNGVQYGAMIGLTAGACVGLGVALLVASLPPQRAQIASYRRLAAAVSIVLTLVGILTFWFVQGGFALDLQRHPWHELLSFGVVPALLASLYACWFSHQLVNWCVTTLRLPLR
jgi:uncharacterized MnhB-related membrane protein